LVCEEHQSDRLVEEIQNVWDKLDVDKATTKLTKLSKRYKL
jgi:hypothetical protein